MLFQTGAKLTFGLSDILSPLYTLKSRKGKCLSFSNSRMNWIDGSTEFKCDKRRSTSFPVTAEITSIMPLRLRRRDSGSFCPWRILFICCLFVSKPRSFNRDNGGLLPDAYLHLVRKKGSYLVSV